MSRHYSLDDANAILPEVIQVIDRLRDQRAGLVVVRDTWRRIAGAEADPVPVAPGPDEDAERRTLRLRMRGILDQMQADAAWLEQRSIVLRDVETGLLDFPALAGDRAVWLCWRSGEQRVGWWHGTDEGFAGRQPVAALPGTPAST